MNIYDLVIQQLVFLGTAADHELNQDVAVAQLEDAVVALRGLPGSEIDDLRDRIRVKRATANAETANFLDELLDLLD